MWLLEAQASFTHGEGTRARAIADLRGRVLLHIVRKFVEESMAPDMSINEETVLTALNFAPTILLQLRDEEDRLAMTSVERDVAVSHLTHLWCAMFLPTHCTKSANLLVRTRLHAYTDELAMVMPCTKEQLATVTTLVHMSTSICTLGANIQLSQRWEGKQLYVNHSSLVSMVHALWDPLHNPDRHSLPFLAWSVIVTAMKHRPKCPCWQTDFVQRCKIGRAHV